MLAFFRMLPRERGFPSGSCVTPTAWYWQSRDGQSVRMNVQGQNEFGYEETQA